MSNPNDVTTNEIYATKERIEEAMEDVPDAEIDAWHNGDNDNHPQIDSLIAQYGAFQIWGGGTRGTEPLSITYPA